MPAAELAERYEIARDWVVMSFSDEKRRQELKETDAAAGNEETGDYQRLLAVQEYLEKHSRIREDIALFVTTSKNKEGINIKDDDIRHVYIESHSMTDISQMAGRLRSGAENVCIILDSQGHPPGEARFDAFFAEHLCQHKLEEENQQLRERSSELQKQCKALLLKNQQLQDINQALAQQVEQPFLNYCMMEFIRNAKVRGERGEVKLIVDGFQAYMARNIEQLRAKWEQQLLPNYLPPQEEERHHEREYEEELEYDDRER